MEKFAEKFEEFEGDEREEQEIDDIFTKTLEEQLEDVDLAEKKEIEQTKGAMKEEFSFYEGQIEAQEHQEVPNKSDKFIELPELLAQEQETTEQPDTSRYEIPNSSVDQTYLEELFWPESQASSPREKVNEELVEVDGNQDKLFEHLIYPEYVTIDSEEALEDYETLT